jgi:hypothetical protein
VLPDETPFEVVAYNFNLTDHTGWLVEAVGTSTYDPANDDWACDSIWECDHGYEISKSLLPGSAGALEHIANQIGKFVAQSAHRKAAALRESVAVCVGFVDGNLTRVWPNISLERTLVE